MCPKQKTKTGNRAKEIGKGVLLAVIIAIMSAALYGILIQRQSVSETSAGIWAYATLAVATLIGCLVSAGRIGEKRLIICGITSAVFAFILLAVGILIFDGGITRLGGNLIAILAGGAIACFFATKKPSKKMKIKKHSR